MSGHVFVVGADLTRLSCDDVLVPTDSRDRRVARSWLPLLPGDAVGRADDEGAEVRVDWPDGGRVTPVPGGDGHVRRAWLVDTVDDGGRGLEWLLDGARQALDAVAGREVAEPAHGRARRLVGLPALGTGWGGAAGERGALLAGLLPVLQEAADTHGFDVALVLRSRSDLAAAQRVRRGRGRWDLPAELCPLAEELGERARAGELAVFVGAGVSAAAGLPTWEQLLEELAARTGLPDPLRQGLAQLPAQDSAALLARELGREELRDYVRERFGPGPYALAHALVAALPVSEMVTTNYDPLLEQAAADLGRPVQVLPFDEVRPGCPWVVKLHGDAAHPESVVLTREEYLHLGDARAALMGVLHALLLTRHVLFVGTSMLDDDVIRIAHQVRSALSGTDTGGPIRRTGTVLALRDDPARARLWDQDVQTVAMGPGDAAPAETARRLEVLLDLVGCLSAPPSGYLLDPAYRGLLDPGEQALADGLADLAGHLPDCAWHTPAGEAVAGVLRRLGQGAGTRARAARR